MALHGIAPPFLYKETRFLDFVFAYSILSTIEVFGNSIARPENTPKMTFAFIHRLGSCIALSGHKTSGFIDQLSNLKSIVLMDVMHI